MYSSSRWLAEWWANVEVGVVAASQKVGMLTESRAQFGTTKYCSAYLRGDQCTNRNCMFLHEPGEDSDSFTRQDLSSMNVASTQQPINRQPNTSTIVPQPQPPPQQALAAATSQPMQRQESKDGGLSNVSESGDGPGLPSHATWATRNAPTQHSRQGSGVLSTSTQSPALAQPQPATIKPPPGLSRPKSDTVQSVQKQNDAVSDSGETATLVPHTSLPKLATSQRHNLSDLLRAAASSDFRFVFSSANVDPKDLPCILNYPPFFDDRGGEKRRAMREQEEEERRKQADEVRDVIQAAAVVDLEEPGGSGSLQLGGEPEERQDQSAGPKSQQQRAIQPPQLTSQPGLLNQTMSLSGDFSNLALGAKGLTPQQQQQLLLSQFKSNSPQAASLLGQFQQNPASGFSQKQSSSSAPGHARQVSRFTFANDSSSASASVKPVANTKLMNQQSAMMPNHFNAMSQPHQSLGGQSFTSGVLGCPPGLRSFPCLLA